MRYRTNRDRYRTVLGYVYPDGHVRLQAFWTASKKEGRQIIQLAKQHGWSRVYDQPKLAPRNGEIDMDTWEEVTNVDHEPAELDSPFWVPEHYIVFPGPEIENEWERPLQERAESRSEPDEDRSRSLADWWRQHQPDLLFGVLFGLGLVVIITWLFASAMTSSPT